MRWFQGTQEASDLPLAVALAGIGFAWPGGPGSAQTPLHIHFFTKCHMSNGVKFWNQSLGVILNHSSATPWFIMLAELDPPPPRHLAWSKKFYSTKITPKIAKVTNLPNKSLSERLVVGVNGNEVLFSKTFHLSEIFRLHNDFIQRFILSGPDPDIPC